VVTIDDLHGVAGGFDELGVVGDRFAKRFAAGVGFLEPVAAEDLRRLREPEVLAWDGAFDLVLGADLLQGVVDRDGEDGGPALLGRGEDAGELLLGETGTN